jgi:hypothetical protein
MFEKVVLTGLLKHLMDHNILSNEEYDSRTKLKTDNATYQLTDDILNALNNKLLIGVIFCDLERHLTVLITKFYYLHLNSMTQLVTTINFTNPV